MPDSSGVATSMCPPPAGPILESSLYVADLDRSAEFYQGLFGWPQFLRDARMCALGAPGDAVLLLFAAGGSEQPAATPFGVILGHGATGRSHLCFKISAADLPAWEARLRARRIAIESRVEWPRGGISLYMRDPDENSLELATPDLWPNY